MYIPLSEDETIILKVHRHWIFIALRMLGLAALALLPLVLVWTSELFDLVVFIGATTPALIVLSALWGLVCWTAFWQFWTTYYMDIWVVTNRRIIDIDYHRLFDRTVSEVRLSRVQDVTTRVRGIFGTFLKFGSVIVQTAGAEKEFVIDQIAHPDRLRNEISQLLK